MRTRGRAGTSAGVHIEDARPDGEFIGFTRRTRGQTGTSTGVHIEDASPDGDINRGSH